MCCCCCCSSCCDCILVLLALVVPPLPVIWKRGCCSVDLLINLLLCTLGVIPGIIHAWFVILDDQHRQQDDEERQLLVVLPSTQQSVLINTQPRQTRITFKHPEPFLENRVEEGEQQIRHHSSIIEEGNLSPLSRDYGTSDDPPPSYDNAMSTLK